MLNVRSAVIAIGFGILLFGAGHRPACGEAICSCGVRDEGFLVNNGVEIPRDSRGIPWSGLLDYDQARGLVVPATTGFRIERLVDGRRLPEHVELELLTGPPVGGREGQRVSAAHLLLVSPRGGFQPGARYLFTDYGGHRERSWARPGERPRQVVVMVSNLGLAEVIRSAGPATLRVGAPLREELRVMTTCGSCSVAVDAAQTAVSLELPRELERWSDVLLVTTTIDRGEIWRPQRSLCSRVAPGESWTGRGTELVFAACPGSDERRCTPSWGLVEGEHQVEMTAWFPGIDVSISATASVVLACDSLAE